MAAQIILNYIKINYITCCYQFTTRQGDEWPWSVMGEAFKLKIQTKTRLPHQLFDRHHNPTAPQVVESASFLLFPAASVLCSIFYLELSLLVKKWTRMSLGGYTGLFSPQLRKKTLLKNRKGPRPLPTSAIGADCIIELIAMTSGNTMCLTQIAHFWTAVK